MKHVILLGFECTFVIAECVWAQPSQIYLYFIAFYPLVVNVKSLFMSHLLNLFYLFCENMPVNKYWMLHKSLYFCSIPRTSLTDAQKICGYTRSRFWPRPEDDETHENYLNHLFRHFVCHSFFPVNGPLGLYGIGSVVYV